MKLTVLGSGGSEGIPVPYCNCKVCKSNDTRLRTSYLINIKNKNFLVEIGPDFRGQQLKYNFSIDYLFISHAHDDHIRGIIELRHILLIAKIKIKKIKILISRKLHNRFLFPKKDGGTTEGENILDKEGISYNYKKLLAKKKLENHILKYYSKYHFKDFSITLFKNMHGRTFSDGFLLEAQNKKIVYLGDANKINTKTKELINKEKPNLLIANVPSFFSKNTHKNDHLDFKTLIELRLKTKKILISHFSHNANLTHADILKKIGKQKNIIAAYDGMQLTI